MKLEMEKIRFAVPCEECDSPIFNQAYKVTETRLTEFGKKPMATVTRLCEICFNEKYPEHKETPENQMDLFDG